MAKETSPEWQDRLLKEREDLKDKLVKLRKKFDDKNFALNNMEWEMLKRQHCAMREYYEALTERCVYYGLIEPEYPRY